MKTTRARAARITRFAWIAFAIVEAILILGVVVPVLLARTAPPARSEHQPGAFHE